MNGWLTLLSALIGYFIGAISFTRMVLRWRAPGVEMEPIRGSVPGSEATFSSTSTGSSLVMHQIGPKWGGITALLDIMKAVVPVLAVRLLLGHPYHLVTALFTIAGHNYPVYYGFKGGKGLSTMMGGFLVFDWLGTVLMMFAGMALGVLSGQAVLIRWTGILLMIPYTWLRYHDWMSTAYVVLANALFWFAMRNEIRDFLALRKTTEKLDQKTVAEFMGMGGMAGLIDRFSLHAMIKRLRQRVGRRGRKSS